jgi:hypothetical protein
VYQRNLRDPEKDFGSQERYRYPCAIRVSAVSEERQRQLAERIIKESFVIRSEVTNHISSDGISITA